MGSTRGLTDENGEVTDTYIYDAFGNVVGSSGSTENDYRFAGEQWDGTLGQYYLRQRYYDPRSGRFTRRDTYEGRLQEPITLHKYLYANSNPVNGIDPSGFYTIAEAQAAANIANKLNQLQFDNGQEFVNRLLGGEDSFFSDLGLNFFLASLPLVGSIEVRKIIPGRTLGGEVTGKAIGVNKADLNIFKGNKQRRIWELTDPKAFQYKQGRHKAVKVGKVNPEPKDPLNVLKNRSIWVDPDKTTRRIGVDPINREFVVFDETFKGSRIYHGHSRTWKELSQQMQNRLIKSGLVNKKGGIL